MYAVVQIGSTIFKSECLTTRNVVCANTGAASATAATTRARKRYERRGSMKISNGATPKAQDGTPDPDEPRTIMAAYPGGNRNEGQTRISAYLRTRGSK